MPVLIDAALSLGRAAMVVLGVAFGATTGAGVAAATAAANSGLAATTASAFAAGWLTGVATASVAAACALTVTAAAGAAASVVAATGVFTIVVVSADTVAGVAGAEAGFGWSPTPCTAAVTGFDASTVDVLVAIAAAAIASGSVVLAGDAGTATISVAATGTAMTAATGTGVAVVAAVGCEDAAGSADVVGSATVTMSETVSLMAAFTMPAFTAPDIAGLETAPASVFEPAAAGWAALGSASCEGVFATAFEEEAASRGCGVSEAVDGSSGRCDGRSGAVGAVRSLPEVSGALLSISAEKLSVAGDWSAFAVLDGVF